MTGHYDKHGNWESWVPAAAKGRVSKSYPVNGFAPATEQESRALLDAAARAAARPSPAPESTGELDRLDDVRDPDPFVEVVAGAALLALVGGFAVAGLLALARYVWGVL